MSTQRTRLDLAFVDCETSGLRPNKNEIIEVAVIRTCPDGLTIKSGFVAKMLPTKSVDPDAAVVNGYNEDEWRASDNLMLPQAVAEKISQITHGAHLVGHNVSFDEAFLLQLLDDQGLLRKWTPWRYQKVCTQALSWPLLVQGVTESVSLASMCDALNIPPEPAVHRALNGASTCRALYLKLIEKYLTA